MADFPILTSPDGSTSINIGSVMLADGVDYGMAGMFQNILGGNPFVDGGQLGVRFNAARTFKFPIRLATVGALTPAGVARTLRQMAQPGAWVDLMLAGVATANAVRFDVIDGRVREFQDVKMWAGAQRRDATLELEVQPFGYSPTWIILASTPSIALPGSIPIPGASIIGDMPGLAQITAISNLPSQQFGGIGTYGYDSFFYTMGNKAPAFLPAASMLQVSGPVGVLATLTGDAGAPASQVQRLMLAPSSGVGYALQTGFSPFVAAVLGTSYFGRYRLHAFARLITPSYGGAVQIAAQVAMTGSGRPTSLASGGLIASIGQPLTLASDGAYSPIPTAFGFFPLGDFTVPTSFNSAQGHRIEIWGQTPSTGLATITLDIAGVWMQSLDSAQGVITRDLQNPGALTAGASFYGMYPFQIDAYSRDVQALGNSGDAATQFLAGTTLGFSLLDRYRGVFPQVSPSMLSIEVMLGARRLAQAYRQEVLLDVPKVWWRFNEPSGASVVLDWSGNGANANATNMLLGASSLLYGEPGGATQASGFAISSSAGVPAVNAPRTLEAWVNLASYGTFALAGMGASMGGAGQSFVLQAGPTEFDVAPYGVVGASWAYAWQLGKTYHIAAAYSGTFVQLYVNGQGLGTQSFAAAVNSAAVAFAGNIPSSAAISNRPMPGGIDEVAVYPSALSAARVLAHYIAGRNTQGGTSAPVYHQGGYAGVSVRYQPRFAFSKEI